MYEQNIRLIHYEQLLQTVGLLANDRKTNLHHNIIPHTSTVAPIPQPPPY
jgi:hypothetical protein